MGAGVPVEVTVAGVVGEISVAIFVKFKSSQVGNAETS
jgi:hypothetical protein